MRTLSFSIRTSASAVLLAGALAVFGYAPVAGAASNPAADLALAKAKPFASLDEKTKKKLLRGKRVVALFHRKNDKGKKMLVAQARGIIKRPPAQVYKYIAQVEKVQEFMPNLIHSKIQKKLAKNKFEMLRIIKVMWTKIRMHLTVELSPTNRLTWRLIRSRKNGIKDTVGAMNFEAINGGKHTLVTYSVYTDTGRAIPGFIRRMLVRKSLPNVIKALKKRVMSNGRWKK